MANLVKQEDIKTGTTILGVTGNWNNPNPDYATITPIYSSLTPTTEAGIPTGYTLENIYNLIVNNATTTAGAHSFASNPSPSMYSTSDIYNALVSLSSSMSSTTIRTGITYLGKTGVCNLGGSCTTNTNCPGGYCGTNSDQSAQICTDGESDIDYCTTGTSCASSVCNLSTHLCVSGDVGSSCTASVECSSGYCDTHNGICKADGSNDSFCGLSSECESNYCNSSNNTCETPLLTSGLVGYWNFDGDDLGDLIGRVNGKVGNAISLGSPKIITSNSALNSNIYSGSFWFYTPTLINASTSGRCPIAVGSGTSEGVCFGATTASYASEVINVIGGNGVVYTVWDEPGASISIGWHHLAYSLNGTAYSIYLDNVLLPVESQNNTFQDNSGVIVGRRNYGDFGWSGYVDELNLFSRSISSGEVSTLYNNGLNNQHGEITDGLELQWNFEDNSWTAQDSGSNFIDGSYIGFTPSSASDFSGLNNNGTYYGNAYITTTSAFIGNSLKLDGTGDWVVIDDNTDFQFDGNGYFTLSTWVNWDGQSSTNKFLSIGEGDSKPSVSIGVNAWTQNDRHIYFYVANSTTAVSASSSDYILPYNEWVLITGVRDGTISRLYINGSLVSETSGDAQGMDLSAEHLDIGSQEEHDYLDFKGKLDEVAVWNRALSADEITTLYNGGTGMSIITP